MFISRLSKREKNIALVVVVLGALFIIYNFALSPMFKKISGLNEEVTAQELKLKKKLNILRKEDSIKLQYQKYAELMRLKASDEQEMSRILSEIEGAAQGINIRILDMKPKKIKTMEFYKNFTVDLIIDGPISEITRFMYELQRAPLLIKAERLHLEKQSSLQPTLKATLQVSKNLIP